MLCGRQTSRQRDDHDDVDVDGDDKPAHCGQLLKVKGGKDVDDGWWTVMRMLVMRGEETGEDNKYDITLLTR